MDDEDNSIIMEIAMCKREECLEVRMFQVEIVESETPGTWRFIGAFALSISIPICPPIMEEVRQVRCAPI